MNSEDDINNDIIDFLNDYIPKDSKLNTSDFFYHDNIGVSSNILELENFHNILEKKLKIDEGIDYDIHNKNGNGNGNEQDVSIFDDDLINDILTNNDEYAEEIQKNKFKRANGMEKYNNEIEKEYSISGKRRNINNDINDGINYGINDGINDDINDGINDNDNESRKQKVNSYREKNKVLNFRDLDEELQQQIKEDLQENEEELYSEVIYRNSNDSQGNRLYKLLLDHNCEHFNTDDGKSISGMSTDEVELSGDNVETAIELEKNSIDLLINKIFEFCDDNKIKHNGKMSKFVEGCRVIDDPLSLEGRTCIKYLSIKYNYLYIQSFYFVKYTDDNKLLITKDFQKFFRLSPNKIMFKKIDVNDIIYLIEKHNVV
jgi:hypothetical protein